MVSTLENKPLIHILQPPNTPQPITRPCHFSNNSKLSQNTHIPRPQYALNIHQKLQALSKTPTIRPFVDALQKANPGVAVSIKTQQAARRILNSTRDNVIRMRLDGVIDEGESDKLEMVRY